MRSRSTHKRQPRASLRITPLVLIIAMFGPACSDTKVSKIHIKLEDRPEDNKTTSVQLPTLPPLCPAAGVAPLQRSAPGTGDHKVFLKWNASVASKNSLNHVFGYCLYRSTTLHAASKNPTCQNCEQVNTVPIAGTACVDDLVKDGATYYYVAAAITQDRQLSTSSNEITAVIPSSKQSVGHPPPGSYPSCRVAASPE